MSSNYTYDVDSDPCSGRGVGTSLKSNIQASFAALEDLLGKPTFEGKGDKVTTEWIVNWIDEKNDERGIFTLYDWCYARNFNNDYEVIQWNVGGNNFDDVLALDALLEKSL